MGDKTSPIYRLPILTLQSGNAFLNFILQCSIVGLDSLQRLDDACLIVIHVIPTQDFGCYQALVGRTGFVFHEVDNHVKRLSTHRVITKYSQVTTHMACLAFRICNRLDITIHTLLVAWKLLEDGIHM